MQNVTLLGRALACAALVASFAAPPRAQAQGSGAAGKIPVTTSSEEARKLYLEGRDLSEKLRATDARRRYAEAVAKDKNFALAYLGLANTAGTTKEFIDATTHAASLAGQVSEGERRMILAVEAGLKGDPAGVLAHYNELVKLFPNDERGLTLLGTVYFGRQEYETAIKHFVKATTVNPSFSAPYNQLGYAYRFVDKFTEAEKAFKTYTQLIPSDPNPYDSYAELLMKMGRFDESIAMYQKALSLDPNFVASYVGIGNDHLCAGRPDGGAGGVRQTGGGGAQHRGAASRTVLDRGVVRPRGRDRQGAGRAQGRVRSRRGRGGRRLDVGRSDADGGRAARSGAARRGARALR